MSAPNSSSTGTLTHAQQADVGGTSFLDLPLELREMIYDLCAPAPKRRGSVFYELPLQSKPLVVGINLLQCSKQVHNEVSQRLKLWYSHWQLQFVPPSTSMERGAEIDLSLAMRALHDLALAKIKFLHFNVRITTGTLTTLRVKGLKILLKLKALICINVYLYLGSDFDSLITSGSSDLENAPFLVGFVICVISHIPRFVKSDGWFGYYRHHKLEGDNALNKISEKYKFVKGSAYTPQQNGDSS